MPPYSKGSYYWGGSQGTVFWIDPTEQRGAQPVPERWSGNHGQRAGRERALRNWTRQCSGRPTGKLHPAHSGAPKNLMRESGKALFLSYASQDAEAARRICEALRATGVEVWFDQNELRGGDAWDQKIRRQIRECTLFIPIISASTQARTEGYFRREWNLAAQRVLDMAPGKPFLLPVAIDDTPQHEALVSDEFLRVQWMRLPQGDPSPEFVARITALLNPGTAGAPTQTREPRAGKAGAAGAPPAVEPPTGQRALPPDAIVREPGTGARPRRLPFAALALPLALVVAGVAVWWSVRTSRINWATTNALPEIARLAEAEQYAAAFSLATQAAHHLPEDQRLAKLVDQVSVPISIETDVPGAEVWFAEYSTPEQPWQSLGATPVRAVRIPRGLKRWRLIKPGFETIERAFAPIPDSSPLKLTLQATGSGPPGMVLVPAGAGRMVYLTGLDHLPPQTYEDFLLDKFEVSNREFAEFVAAGGYRKPEYWKHPIMKDGRALPWTEAMLEFRDTTGQPGPATWDSGTYPTGRADFPVAGVSWYEAAAFAEYAGKALPTIFHWNRAALSDFVGNASPVIRFSNFTDENPIPRNKTRGMNTYGTFDLAGNVKEWCWNAADPGGSRRYILGGASNEPVYMFNDPDAQSPLSRLPTYGFRCIKPAGAIPAQLLEPVQAARRDLEREKPVADDAFEIFRSFYAYDKTPLAPIIESTDESAENWKRQKVTFNAAYGNERVTAYLYLPRGVTPPYQTIVLFPGSGALRTRTFPSSDSPSAFDFIIRSGRAVLFPVYKSTWERGDGLLSDRPNMTNTFREHIIYWYKDYARSLDYLESRQDIDVQRIGYLGSSWGAVMGPILLGLDSRSRAAVWVIGGFWQQKGPPEVEQINFAARVKIPVLMLNGRHDFVFPVESSQIPMFTWTGTPANAKRHILYESGHSVPRKEQITETLAWFDRHLGPVR